MVGAAGEMTVAVVGTGSVGTAMAGLLPASGYRVVSVYDPRASSAEAAGALSGARVAATPGEAAAAASIVLLTTPDDCIARACREIAESVSRLQGKVFVHMSGALTLQALEPAAKAGAKVLSVHPLQTFPDAQGALRSLPGSTFGVTCEPDMEAWAGEFVSHLGGRALFVRDEDKVLYHAAAAIACNMLVMVEHSAQWICERLGFEADEANSMYMPLVRATVDNLERLGPAAALTGPLARGDAGTIAAHIEALEPYPDLLGLYTAASLWGLKIVVERGEVEGDLVEEIRRLLERRPGG